MKSSTVITLSALVASAAAGLVKHHHHQHMHFHEKRDEVIVTQTVDVWETVMDIQTVWVNAQGSPVSTQNYFSTMSEAPASTSNGAAGADFQQLHGGQSSSLVTVTTSSTSTSTTTTADIVTTTTAAAAAPPPPPPASSSPAAAPAAPPAGGSADYAAEVLEGASVSDGCTQGTPCVGDMTFYNLTQPNGSGGPVACGGVYYDTDLVVAVDVNMMGSLSSGLVENPLCFRYIQITNPANGKTARGQVVDKCAGCHADTDDIDLSYSLFIQLADPFAGRISNVQWYWTK